IERRKGHIAVGIGHLSWLQHPIFVNGLNRVAHRVQRAGGEEIFVIVDLSDLSEGIGDSSNSEEVPGGLRQLLNGRRGAVAVIEDSSRWNPPILVTNEVDVSASIFEVGGID